MDFAGDGTSDAFWRNTNTGDLIGWDLNESTITSITSPTTSGGTTVTPNASWSIAGFGDFNGDNTTDILWRQNNGTLAEWLVEGSTITSSQSPTFHGDIVSSDASWSVAGTGDFNGDGKADIMAQHRRHACGVADGWLDHNVKRDPDF